MTARTLIKTLAAMVAVTLTACSPRHKDKTHMSITGPVSQQNKPSACSSVEGQWQFAYDISSVGKQFEFKRSETGELLLVASFDRPIAVNGKIQEAARANTALKATAACTEEGTVKMDVTYSNGDTDKMEFQIGPDQTAGTLVIAAKRRGETTVSGSQIFQKISVIPNQAKAN